MGDVSRGAALWRTQAPVLNGFLRSYVEWRESCEGLRHAYERWLASEPCDRDLAFAAYTAALEREARAADVHSDWARRLHEHRDRVRQARHRS